MVQVPSAPSEQRKQPVGLSAAASCARARITPASQVMVLVTRVDLADCVEPGERQHDLARSTRDLSADKAGIAALRHDRRAGVVRELEDRCDTSAVEPGRSTSGVWPAIEAALLDQIALSCAAGSVMAYFSPTMAVNLVIRSCQSGEHRPSTSMAYGRLLRGGGAPQPVVDGFAQAFIRYWHDRDRAWRRAASSARRCENRLAAASTEIASLGQVEHGRGAGAAAGRKRAALPRRDGAWLRAAAAPSAHNAKPACRARAALRSPDRIASAARPQRMSEHLRRWPRAPARRGGAASACRGRRRWWIPCPTSSGRHRRSDRSVRQIGQHMRGGGRRDMAGDGWPTAPRPACRRRAGIRAPPDGPARARRCCRGRRWQDPTPGNRALCGSTSVSGPGQKACRKLRRRRVESAQAAARLQVRRHARSAD